MKVITNAKYGSPSVLEIKDVNKISPKYNQILVKVKYSSVNRTDVGFLRGKPFVTRLFTGLLKPKYPSLGCEFSGTVSEVGNDVSLFKVGDRVFGFDDHNFGGYSEYKLINEDEMIEEIPSNISYKQAAISLEGSHYALFFVYKISKPNAKVFVNGATGAIGSAAVQLLKAMGHYVEASCTTEQLTTIEALGVDKVIDWQKNDISKIASKCDVYLDSVGKSSFKEARKILNPDGLYMSSELGKYGQNPLLSLINPVQRLFTKQNIIFPIPKTRKQEAETIKKYLSTGKFDPLLDKQYEMEEIPLAFRYVESGKKVGNVVIKIS